MGIRPTGTIFTAAGAALIGGVSSGLFALAMGFEPRISAATGVILFAVAFVGSVLWMREEDQRR